MPTITVSFTSASLMMLTRPEIASLTSITSATLFVFASQAEAQMLALVSRRYTVPFTVAVPVLETLATDLAVYRVLSRRLYTTRDAKEKSGIQALYDEAMATLSAIALGQVPLVDASGTLLTARTDAAPVWSTTQDFEPTFHEGPLGTQVIDPDKIDAELDRRDLNPFGDRVR